MPRGQSILERFWAKVAPPDQNRCWTWTGAGASTNSGYGRFAITSRQLIPAHVFAYELTLGPVPPGMQLDHLCRNRACVNPSHLEPVTCRDNLLRGHTKAAENASKTHCPHGHEYTSENVYIPPGRSVRMCRACMALRARKNRRYVRGPYSTSASRVIESLMGEPVQQSGT